MCHAILGDARFYELLLRFDEDLAERTRSQGCPCAGRLHSAKYPRKPRGRGSDVDGYGYRFSFCCDREGCRRRVTPPSLRFLGRRVYLGALVVLVAAMLAGLTPRRAGRLRSLVGVDRRTVERWRQWWRESLPATAFWRLTKARLMPPVEESGLPRSLLERFSGTATERLIQVLALLLPLTTSSRSAMVVADPQRMLAVWRQRAR